MHTLQTKVPERVGALFEEVCREKGKTPYMCLKELVYRFLIEHGHQVYEDAPIESKVDILKQKVEKHDQLIQRTREELEEIASKYDELKKQLVELMEKLNKQGIASWAKKR